MKTVSIEIARQIAEIQSPWSNATSTSTKIWIDKRFSCVTSAIFDISLGRLALFCVLHSVCIYGKTHAYFIYLLHRDRTTTINFEEAQKKKSTATTTEYTNESKHTHTDTHSFSVFCSPKQPAFCCGDFDSRNILTAAHSFVS